MNNLRRDLLAVLATIGIIVVALMLLNYAKASQVASILMFGYILDALVSTGIVGNLIVFLLVKLTKWNSLRIALWTFVIIHGLPVITLALIGNRIDPQFRFAPVLIGYVVSFLFWFGLHWAWQTTSKMNLPNLKQN